MTKTEKATINLQKHLSPSEKLLWVGVPKITPYSIIIGLSMSFAFLGLYYLIYSRIGLERSFSNFFYALYRSIPTIISIAIAVVFSTKEHEAYGLTEQYFLIKKGTGKLITIPLQSIVNLESQATFLGWNFNMTVLVTDKTERAVLHTVYTVLNGEELNKKLLSYIKK